MRSGSQYVDDELSLLLGLEGDCQELVLVLDLDDSLQTRLSFLP